MNNLKITLLTLLAICIFSNSYSQSYINSRLSLKLGYYKTHFGYPEYYNKKFAYHRIDFTANYGFLKYFDGGLYGGYLEDFNGIDPQKTRRVDFGINANLQLLSLFIRSNDFRIDAYIGGKMGICYTPEKTAYFNTRMFEYGGGAGIVFYPLKHLGVFGEYYYGRFFVNDRNYFKLGLSYKLYPER